jgi:hypothetical protein
LDGKAKLMADLLVRIKKKTDSAAALSCVRPDGSVTWWSSFFSPRASAM